LNQEVPAKNQVGARRHSLDQIGGLERNLLRRKPLLVLCDYLRHDVEPTVPGEMLGEIQRGKPMKIASGRIDNGVNV
jgi:hypothetical protein